MTSASRWLLMIAALIAALSSTSRAANYSQGDEITLTRDEPLLFREKLFRQGKVGEKFTVLAHRADIKKVFVSATDQTGKQIALSVPEEAVAPVPVEVEKLRTTAITAARLGKFADALRMIEQAIRSAPSDAALPQTRNAIAQMQGASVALARAKADQRNAGPQAAQTRKSAATIDHPNALFPNDTSNQQRAQRMREQADELEQRARQNVADTENQFRTASDALVGQASAEPASPPELGSPSLTGMPGGQPGLELTPAQMAQNKAIEEKEAAKREFEKKKTQDSSAQMAALNARDLEKKGIGQPNLDRTPAQRENAATAQKPQGVIEKNARSEKIETWDEQSFRDRVEQVASGFTIKSGPRAGEFNFNRSYGADQRELGERFRASIRNGLGGYSKEKFMAASAEEQTNMIADNSRLYMTANGMFGDEMAPDELARRLVNTFDELLGMEANQAHALLLRFWSTTRVAQMSAKELLEFKKRFDDNSRSLGVPGRISLRDLFEIALNAKVITDRGRGIEK